jgi:Tol biopolymer transport system component
VLPAPLLFVDEGYRLARLDADGVTRTTIVEEKATIISFVRSPDGTTIAYITVDANQRATLVRVAPNGSGRTELARGTIRGVTVAADGSVPVGALFDTASADGKALAGGVWDFPATGGGPALLVAATEPTATADGVHYEPAA